MWRINSSGKREFNGGKTDWDKAATIAQECPGFVEDVEDELVADEQRSCYNCRLRRWTMDSFECKR